MEKQKIRTKEPIRDLQKVREIKEWLLVNKTFRDYFLFFMGLNTGLRGSDLLRIRVMDVKNKDTLQFVTQKTNREVKIPLNSDLRFEIEKFVKGKSETDYIFQSREGENKSLSIQMFNSILKEAGTACGVPHLSSHVLRKSFGYHYYLKNKDVFFLMRLYGHGSQHQTMNYIGITQDQIRESLEGFIL